MLGAERRSSCTARAASTSSRPPARTSSTRSSGEDVQRANGRPGRARHRRRCEPAELRGGDPAENAEAIRRVLAGENGARRDAILLNAAATIAAGGLADDIADGLELAREAVDSGAAAERLEQLVAFSREGRLMGRFRDALSAPGLQGIAEVKRRSPVCRRAACGCGSRRARRRVRAERERRRSRSSSTRVRRLLGRPPRRAAAARLPLLAKGFFSTEDDLRIAREAGADAALLILRDLDDETARRLLGAADGSRARHARRGARLGGALPRRAVGRSVIGINARDLATFEIDRRAQLDLVASAPRDRIVVAESGIESRAQGAAAELAGADAILVGSALMRAPDPAAKLGRAPVASAREGVRPHACRRRRSGGCRRRGHGRIRARRSEPAARSECASGARHDALGRGRGR